MFPSIRYNIYVYGIKYVRKYAHFEWTSILCPYLCTTNLLEMQRYIDISSYRDILGSDTVSIHI